MLSLDLVYIACKSSFKLILKILIFLAKATVPQNYIGSCDIYFSIPNTERLSFIHFLLHMDSALDDFEKYLYGSFLLQK